MAGLFENPVNPFCPLPLDQENRPFLPRLHAALVKELYKQSRVALVSLALPVFFLRLIVSEAVPKSPAINWIFVALGLTILGRIAWGTFLARHPERLASIEARHLAFALGSALTSACFVALNIVVFPILSPFPLGLLCVCQAGISATAMVTMACSPLAYVFYMLPMIGSMIIMVILHPTPVLAVSFVCILLAFTAAQLGVFVAVHRSMRDNFLLQLKLGEMALRDVLTGLRNRRYLEEFLEAEIPRLVRSWHHQSIARGNPSRSLAVIMVDLDHFKQVNDTYGHAAGDEVLKQVAQLLSEITRKPDLVVRWGGEEFVILALDVPRSQPMIAAERIRVAMEKHTFRLPSGETFQKTCSLGYAYFPFLPELPERLDWEQVLNLADGGLYRAKLAGRNRAIGVLPGDAPAQEIVQALKGVDEGLHRAVAADMLRLTDAGTMESCQSAK